MHSELLGSRGWVFFFTYLWAIGDMKVDERSIEAVNESRWHDDRALIHHGKKGDDWG